MNNKILFFAGSARRDSINKKLARSAYELAKTKAADATFVDLIDYPMPIYNGDLEAESGLPENAKKLKQIFVEHKGLFIASPEYNSSISPLLKNTLDWISRKETPEEAPLRAYVNKVAALSAASAGHFGGLRGLVPLRMLLSNIKVTVLPDQLVVPYYPKAFNESGELIDDKVLASLDNVVKQLIEAVG
jgi:NAD(P)H-dependent FMN reductase